MRRSAIVVCCLVLSILAVFASDAPSDLQFSTFSLCAIDPNTGESGAIVTTRVPFVGRAVPWARAGVGAVATQSWTIVQYGEQGLDLLERGVSPEDAITQLLSDDAGREDRQLGMIDMEGRTANFSGEKNSPWAGGRSGKNYTAQGNILVGPEVIDAVADSFESTEGSSMPLAERMILALEAGQKVGGDKRWGRLQSAAIRIADPNDPGRGGDNISLSTDAGEHATPVAELKRIYMKTQQRLGHRSFSKIQGPDVVELKRKLQKLGFWRAEAEPIPDGPSFDADRSLMRRDPAAFQAAIDAYYARARVHNDAFATFDDEAVKAVDAFRKAHGIDYPGLPPGMVDAALVDKLQSEYERAIKSAK